MPESRSPEYLLPELSLYDREGNQVFSVVRDGPDHALLVMEGVEVRVPIPVLLELFEDGILMLQEQDSLEA